MRMKSILAFTLILLLFTHHGWAQPVLQSSQLPQAGEVYVHDWMNTAPAQIPDAGPNVTWDLSQTTFNSLEDSGQYVNIFSTLPDWTYNLGFRFYSTVQPKYDLYQLSSAGLGYSGYNRADQAIDTLILTSPSPVLPVPLNYGAVIPEPFSGRYVTNGFPVNFSGQTRLKADAWGTLILPWATYNDVLRVHVYDSLNVFGQAQINSSYYYWSASETNAVMVIQDDNPPIGYAIRKGVPVGLTAPLRDAPLELRFDPRQKRAWLQLPGNEWAPRTIALCDFQGRQLKHWNMEVAGGTVVVLDLAGIPAGAYLLRIRQKGNEQQHAGKLIVF
jgi:hypothetical protein